MYEKKIRPFFPLGIDKNPGNKASAITTIYR